MVNVAAVAEALGPLTLMKYFPSEDAARTALVEMVCEMIDHEDQAEWLANRMLRIYREWPGPYEMRACFCGRFKPKDGINAYSETYPDGLPPDPTAPPRPVIAAPKLKPLPPGHVATADPEFEASIRQLADEVSKFPDRRRKSIADEERELADAPKRYLTEEQKALRLAALQASLKTG